MTASQLSQDPESLLPAAARRRCPCRGLDWCLLLGLCALGAAILGLALCSAWGVLARPLGTPETAPAGLSRAEDVGAQMLATNSLTNDRQMKWDYHPDVDGVIFSSNFNYHKDYDELEVKVGGLYFIYAQLAVTCTVRNCTKERTINLVINQKSGNTEIPVLTVSLHLSSKSEDSMSKFSAVLRPLKKGDFLFVKLKSNGKDDDDWHLEQTNKKDNFFGLFRLPRSAEPTVQ
ncbi:tumor necrosis factor ligand superfamily member 9 [Emydura macquarii macquarii]|uniref:tumor necrosis factor ligand superfamily member 9 n=1 Tax=Emydura macquarii macquarii TaxID=1129001 RepID=UPI00352BC47D